MKWVRFWFRVSGSSYETEEYNVYPSSFTDEDIKESLEIWVEDKIQNQADGYFYYDFEKVELPPKKWLLDKIENNKARVEILKNSISFYEKIVDENYRLNDKIDKLKKNIDDEMV